MKTSELTEAALDWAVAKCEGLLHDDGTVSDYWQPSELWEQGGPIIERECISVGLNESSAHEHTKYTAAMVDTTTTPWTPLAWLCGSTPLIAAMRCYVASKLGDEVEIPQQLNT